MCIRDRYQRRVHGNKKMQSKDTESTINVSDFAFYKTLLHADKSALKVGKEDADLYLSRTLFPTLVLGLEDLGIEVERLQKEGDPRVCARFNACAYLAEYLMRNNPKYNPEKSDSLAKLYAQYARKEKIERVLENRKGLLKSLFGRAEGGSFSLQIKSFLSSLDGDLQLPVKIADSIDLAGLLAKELKSFDEFWEKWVEQMISQETIDGEMIEQALEVKYPTARKQESTLNLEKSNFYI
eukprot:TRINITY_DN1794_c0_g1_i4.p2 TRINITY_DN1794_c0_g1~~TRINITY_DN1794_c0_g1_i4.p2  ORF type:complete len:239 (+),score=57.59 TRINITY_DN1794_c0_g1_i4:185-901(+)